MLRKPLIANPEGRDKAATILADCAARLAGMGRDEWCALARHLDEIMSMQ
jgi:hypothetical protein